MPSSSLPVATPSLLSTKLPKLDIKLRVGQAFLSVVKGESLRDTWLTESCILKKIKQRYDFRDASDFTVTVLKKAVLKVNDCIDIQGDTNTTGQFRLMKSILDLSGESDGKYTRVSLYYITDETKKPCFEGFPRSNDNAAWKDFYDQAEAAGQERLTRSAKKPRHWDDIDTALLEFNSKTKNLQVRLKEVVPLYEHPPYWESTEAKNMFCPKPDETVEDALARKCKALDRVINEPDGYKLILPGDGDPDDLYSARERMTLQFKAMHMRLAYKLALDKMGSGLSWGKCCKEAADSLAKAGISMGSETAIKKWHRLYRVADTLPHSNPFYATATRPQPK